MFHALPHRLKNLAVQALQVDPDSISFDSRTFQGRLRTSISGTWGPSQVDVLQGSLYVPIHQARALLVAHLLEPVASDSLSRWGLFNTAYEITDHISNHRQLQLAQWMYAQDRRILQQYGEDLHKKLPALRKEFQTRMDRDERFKEDPEQRIDFWMRQIPYHDPTFNQYPVLRVDQAPMTQVQ